MATLDELANRISVLENQYSTLNSVVNGHTTEIIGIEAGSILVQVLHLFSYHTVPEKE